VILCVGSLMGTRCSIIAGQPVRCQDNINLSTELCAAILLQTVWSVAALVSTRQTSCVAQSKFSSTLMLLFSLQRISTFYAVRPRAKFINILSI